MIGSGLFSTQRARLAHLVRGGGGLAGEVSDLRSDIDTELDPLAAIAVEEFVDPPAADSAAIKFAIDTVAAPTTYSGADLDGVVGSAVLSPPRNITITTAGVTPADAPGTALINGLDVNGAELSEVIIVSQVAASALGVRAFASVKEIVLPTADGTGATLEFGFGDVLGLAKPIKERAGFTGLIREIAVGALVTTGTVVDAATSTPNGTYEPDTVPDGANDYAIYYEWDAEA